MHLSCISYQKTHIPYLKKYRKETNIVDNSLILRSSSVLNSMILRFPTDFAPTLVRRKSGLTTDLQRICIYSSHQLLYSQYKEPPNIFLRKDENKPLTFCRIPSVYNTYHSLQRILKLLIKYQRICYP